MIIKILKEIIKVKVNRKICDIFNKICTNKK
jgi:hypothetical protein